MDAAATKIELKQMKIKLNKKTYKIPITWEEDGFTNSAVTESEGESLDDAIVNVKEGKLKSSDGTFINFEIDYFRIPLLNDE